MCSGVIRFAEQSLWLLVCDLNTHPLFHLKKKFSKNHNNEKRQLTSVLCFISTPKTLITYQFISDAIHFVV